MPQLPLAPAAGYRQMEAALLAIDPLFFTHSPPRHGMRLEVVGTDDIITVWDVPTPIAQSVATAFRGRSDVRIIGSSIYSARD